MVCQLIQDHPRRCGENKEAQAIKVLCTGSPPQVRGKHYNRDCGGRAYGITPAGAGKTAPTQRTRRNAWDHPRRCGENKSCSGLPLRRRGSPPQVRGKREEFSRYGQAGWITPAGAGKTV